MNNLGGMISVRACNLFTGDKIRVPLPAGLDIYLTGIKTHDSEIRLTRFLLSGAPEFGSANVAIDCGAHLGFYSLVLSSCFNKVVCFEPSPRIGKLLQSNTIGKANVTVVRAMLADKEDSSPFFVYPVKYSEYNTGESSAIEDGFESRIETVTVPSTTLDIYCTQHEVIPSLIKIDVEGGELRLLEGARKVLQDHAPIIVIELRRVKFDLLYGPVVEFLEGIGYSAYRITREGSLILIDDVKQWITNLKDESDNLAFSKRPVPKKS
jgi:FkbM family methyltransferase